MENNDNSTLKFLHKLLAGTCVFVCQKLFSDFLAISQLSNIEVHVQVFCYQPKNNTF
jgi:hypothetical protein